MAATGISPFLTLSIQLLFDSRYSMRGPLGAPLRPMGRWIGVAHSADQPHTRSHVRWVAQNSLRWIAATAACARLSAPSVFIAEVTYDFTVRSATVSAVAICLFGNLSPTRRSPIPERRVNVPGRREGQARLPDAPRASQPHEAHGLAEEVCTDGLQLVLPIDQRRRSDRTEDGSAPRVGRSRFVQGPTAPATRRDHPERCCICVMSLRCHEKLNRRSRSKDYPFVRERYTKCTAMAPSPTADANR
jgi:hypothetical protein